MKNLHSILFGSMVSLFLTTSCQRDSLEETNVVKADNATAPAAQISLNAKSAPSGVCNPNAYIITLESRTQVNGNWEWIWSVLNLNPGNGSNGTAQDLSNWGMQFGSCVNSSSVVGAAYSSNGTTWTNFPPTYAVNPSQGCLTSPVLKFDFGTTGGAKTYYRVIVNQDYQSGSVPGYYKSGTNTGCCTFYFNGINGCGGPIEIVE